MEEIGLFPLGMVLLPTERAPLHIFEPRYRELIGECLEQDGEFGLVYADDDGIRAVGTRAAVVEVLERFDDGRLNVLVEGRDRFRLHELTEGRSFQTGLVEPLGDAGGDADPDHVERAVALLRRIAELAGSEAEGLEPSTDVPSFELAARVELEPRLKQQLLELRSEPMRLRALVRILRTVAKALELREATSKLAARNGRAPHGRPHLADE